jgi:hypothetical protein
MALARDSHSCFINEIAQLLSELAVPYASFTSGNLHCNRVELLIIALSIGFEERLQLICARHCAGFAVHRKVYLFGVDSSKRNPASLRSVLNSLQPLPYSRVR